MLRVFVVITRNFENMHILQSRGAISPILLLKCMCREKIC